MMPNSRLHCRPVGIAGSQYPTGNGTFRLSTATLAAMERMLPTLPILAGHFTIGAADTDPDPDHVVESPLADHLRRDVDFPPVRSLNAYAVADGRSRVTKQHRSIEAPISVDRRMGDGLNAHPIRVKLAKPSGHSKGESRIPASTESERRYCRSDCYGYCHSDCGGRTIHAEQRRTTGHVGASVAGSRPHGTLPVTGRCPPASTAVVG